MNECIQKKLGNYEQCKIRYELRNSANFSHLEGCKAKIGGFISIFNCEKFKVEDVRKIGGVTPDH